MKSFFHSLLSVLALAFVLVGCEKPEPPPPDGKVLFQAIEDNVHAMEKKDLEAVMATIHPRAPGVQDTREQVAQVFEVLDLKYALSDLKVVSATPEEAAVSFVQKTEKTGGEGEFRNNIQHGTHILRPDNGKWKIYNTIVTSLTGLDGKALPNPESTEPEPATAPAPAPPTAPPTPAEPAPKPAAPPTPPAPDAPPATPEKPPQ